MRDVLQKCCKNESTIQAIPANPHKYWLFKHISAESHHSHSTVAGGLEVMS